MWIKHLKESQPLVTTFPTLTIYMSTRALVTSRSSPYNQDMTRLPEEPLIERLNTGYFSKLRITPFAAGELLFDTVIQNHMAADLRDNVLYHSHQHRSSGYRLVE